MEKVELNDKEKNLVFWASFLALMAAGIGFGIRVMSIPRWIEEFAIDQESAGAIFGASLWPIAVGMILFSLVVDKVGYRVSMILAFACQLISTIWTATSSVEIESLKYSFILAGFGHGIIEACINPLCATMYKQDKSKMLNILHAAWPAGIVVGAVLCLSFGADWRVMFWSLVIPVVLYGFVFFKQTRYPEDERIENGISYMEMMKEYGGLSIFLAATFLIYEIGGQLGMFPAGTTMAENKLWICLGAGAVIGLIGGFLLKSPGKPLFFILCVIMIPLATAEIATDGWIKKLMEPVLAEDFHIDSGWAIVLSAFIMMVLRFFAGVPLKFFSPPMLLFVSSIFSIIGLFALSVASGWIIFVAFVIYGVGQTFYWPTVLGLTSEQFPKGGAMTLNTVSAMGLLTVGIFGMPFLGTVGNVYDEEVVKKEQPALYAATKEVKNEETGEMETVPKYTEKKNFFGYGYTAVNVPNLTTDPSLLTEKGKELMEKAKLPDDPTKEQFLESLKQKKAFDALGKAGRTEEGNKLVKNIQDNGRNVLKVAAVLPAIMAVSFLLIILYFRSKGGYKPVELDKE